MVHFGVEFAASSFAKVSRSRTYTIYSVNLEQNEISVLIHIHQVGLASDWAKHVTVGDMIYATSPGYSKEITNNCECSIFVGDSSSLPCIDIQLSKQRIDKEILAIVDVEYQRNIPDLRYSDRSQVNWVCSKEGASVNETIRQLIEVGIKPDLWVATDLDTLKELRQLAYNLFEPSRDNFYFSSFWRRGRTEEGHRIDKSSRTLA